MEVLMMKNESQLFKGDDVNRQYGKEFGDKLPPLSSDVIAKKIFNPDEHPERIQFLLREISKDEGIVVESAAKQEGYTQSNTSKNVIFDVASWLRDGRIADLEFQKVPQDYIMARTEIYSANMLMIQYSVKDGEPKSHMNYANAKGTLLIVLMVKTPQTFEEKCKNTEKYIHRFYTRTSDTGVVYTSIASEIYVQLDKCLEQFKKGYNAESADRLPDELQTWLSMIADINDEDLKESIDTNPVLKEIKKEVSYLSQDKEVQAMLLEEKFAISDWITAQSSAKEEGKEEGRLLEIIDSIISGDYSIERGAEKAKLSVEELREKAALLGKNLKQ
jgi:predicted transposase/invertase (TIGR01784 family)